MPNSLEAATDMAMMDIADRTIILTDHTSGADIICLFARFGQVDAGHYRCDSTRFGWENKGFG